MLESLVRITIVIGAGVVWLAGLRLFLQSEFEVCTLFGAAASARFLLDVVGAAALVTAAN